MEELIAIGAAIGVFLLLWLVLLPKVFGDRAVHRTRNIIDKIAEGGTETSGRVEDIQQDEDAAAASYKAEATGIAKLLLSLPGAEKFYVLMLKAGRGAQAKSIVIGMFGFFFILSVVLFPLIGALSVLVALLLCFFVPRAMFKREIRKRNEAFINLFPEAIDMIVRSVKSGHPLNTALRMIGDNMEDPVGSEFRQVVNEVSYGRPLIEALRRLSKRIDEPDVHFFVVVLAVQQETGGNLAEILSNLSSVIRGRKQLFQKIRAMTSEGRATMYVLGALPIVQFGAVYITSPDYLTPLYTTSQGNIIALTALGLIGLAYFIVNKMIQIDV